MARLKETTRLSLKVQTGLNDSGNPITATRSFSNINPDIADDDAQSILTKIGALQMYDVTQMSRTDTAVLGDE